MKCGFNCIVKMKNRSRYEVIQCKIYLDSLLQSGLIQEVNIGNKMVYRITHKGNKFLSYYDQMKELLPVGIEENIAEEYYHLST
ncbi:MAG: hypothetical protein K0S67_2188 [Nitrososphaeraceae archaeon]|nr:hypothetical protein [Nitrososphaeraceae archaeon]